MSYTTKGNDYSMQGSDLLGTFIALLWNLGNQLSEDDRRAKEMADQRFYDEQTARMNYEYDLLRYEKQYEYQMQALADERAYNSPSAQMARMKEAGINPNMAINQVTNTFSPTPVQQAAGMEVPFRNIPASNITELMENFSRLAQQGGNQIEANRMKRIALSQNDQKLQMQEENAKLRNAMLELDIKLKNNEIDKFTYDFLMQRLKDTILVEDTEGNLVQNWTLDAKGRAAANRIAMIKAMNLPEEYTKKFQAYTDKHNIDIWKQKDIQRIVEEAEKTFPDRWNKIILDNNLTQEKITKLIHDDDFWRWLSQSGNLIDFYEGQLQAVVGNGKVKLESGETAEMMTKLKAFGIILKCVAFVLRDL